MRLIDHEKAAFNALAETLGVPPSTLLRRMVREAVSAGPTLFKDDLGPVIDASNEVSAVGRNINQIARAINSGKVDIAPTVGADIRHLAAVLLALKKEMRGLVDSAKKRRIRFVSEAVDG